MTGCTLTGRDMVLCGTEALFFWVTVTLAWSFGQRIKPYLVSGCVEQRFAYIIYPIREWRERPLCPQQTTTTSMTHRQKKGKSQVCTSVWVKVRRTFLSPVYFCLSLFGESHSCYPSPTSGWSLSQPTLGESGVHTGQVATSPQGWWSWETNNHTDSRLTSQTCVSLDCEV